MDAVVVTHNSVEDIRAMTSCDTTVSSFDRVLVVDNASNDESRDVALEAGLDVVALDENLGLSSAVNIGASYTKGDYFALLNPDVRLCDPDGVDRLERHLADPTVGAVAPALVLPSGDLQDSARRVPTPTDLLMRRLTGRQPDAVYATQPVNVEWVVAACLVMRRSAFEQIGGFNERFFLYFEDVDLSVRLRAAGFRVRYDPTVKAFHEHAAASRSSLISRAARQHVRSACRFYAGHPRYLLPRQGQSGEPAAS